MGAMFSSFFRMLTSFFTAGENLGETFVNVTLVGKVISEDYLKTTMLEQAAAYAALQDSLVPTKRLAK